MAYPPPPAGPNGNGKRRREEPDQASLIQTTFYMPPALAIKTASSGFQKYDAQGGIARHRAQIDFERASAQIRAQRQFRALMEEENRRIRSSGGVAWPIMGIKRQDGGLEGSAEGIDVGSRSTAEDPTQVAQEPEKPEVQSEPPVVNPRSEKAGDLPFRPFLTDVDLEESIPEAQRTIVIHPGSRFLRIGRATDSLPLTVPNCIYRRFNREAGVKVPNGFGKRAKSVERREEVAVESKAEERADAKGVEKETGVAQADVAANAEAGPSLMVEEKSVCTSTQNLQEASSQQPPLTATFPGDTLPTPTLAVIPTTGTVDKSVSTLTPVPEISEEERDRQEGLTEVISDARKALRDRMRYNKLRLPPGKAEVPVNMVARFNANSVPVELPTLSDPHGVEWLTDYSAEKMFPHPDLHVPEDAPYELRYPLRGRTLNTEEYDPEHPELLISDIQEILEHALEQLSPAVHPRRLRNYSVVLVVPDWIEKGYIETMGTLLLQTMGFKQLGILQESVCATFGAGLSTACIVDIGATRTSVTCVDDGMVLQESRQVLNFGGDDITTFLVDLLHRSSFPYKECDLNSRLDWELMDDLKIRTCTLMDSYVTNNVHKFYVKRKDALTKEYTIQTYDQPVISSSCLFDPRAIDWRVKDSASRPPLRKVAFDEDGLGGLEDDLPSLAMQNSVRRAAIPDLSIPADIPPFDLADSAQTEGVSNATAVEQDPLQQMQAQQAPQNLPSALPVVSMAEIMRDSNRLTLEYAVTESLFAVETKSLSLASAILVLGGTSLIEGLAPALQWRIDYMIERKTGLQGKCAILPPPRGMDPRIVSWRGGAVYSRLDSMSEVWIRQGEWSDLRMRAYRARLG